MKPPLVFAHRGASSEAPENTKAAFLKALEQGTDGLEFDVQLSKDNKVVIFHDENLERITSLQGFIKDYYADELKQIDIGSWFHKKFSNERILLLDELLSYISRHRLPLIIELKNAFLPYPELEKKVIHLVENYQLQDHVILSSFVPNSLRECKKWGPDIETAMLYFPMFRTPFQLAKEVGASQIHAPWKYVNEGFMEQAQSHGLKVCPYTIDRRETILKMVRLGVDSFITNKPGKTKKLIQHQFSSVCRGSKQPKTE
ncbi:glycerophosphodiester phosphodiesterase [Microaerobacter geothermalis]|uniref:glycerophosphodiester phosphodiesterase n=1 Tax=Microaerobacter geothermalis TaxID=674972 RepID=UPI001F44DE6F|nr:glycerophosphodiester phosphodiesterase family protein [Microaerobacter geothermalis]MCF6093303.1 glycerophosphodiester phosphodiesterase [Microaerobacter geothermalis]